MNIDRNDLNGLQSAYRTVLTESQETGYNGGMNDNTNYLDVYKQDEIIMRLEDNGEWEYVRLGFGKDVNGLYYVSLDDDGEQYHKKHYIKPELDLDAVLQLGLKMRVFDQYDGDDDIRVNEEMYGTPEEQEFLNKIRA